MTDRKKLADALRILAADAIQSANSGHPGAPMGMSDMAEALWRRVLKHNPANPAWVNRDRFVLSNGHASMLLYGLLHLSGYDLSMDDIKNFRQLDSRTPGHPEYGHTPGVETTTGPLGQGLATATGMALAERVLAHTFNRDGFNIVDHHTYVFAGDGCLMEGLAQEACSLAGTLGLGKLIVLYDDNGISIDGKVKGWFADDTPARFAACGWHVIPGVDGHNGEAIDAALDKARARSDKPSLICCHTVIGYGSPNKSGSSGVHGSPLGASEIALVREKLGWTHPPFEIPRDVYEAWNCRDRGAQDERDWNELFAAYSKAYPDLAAEFERRMKGALPGGCQKALVDFAHGCMKDIEAGETPPKTANMATRTASGEVLSALAPVMPELFGGSADLTGSVNTWHSLSREIRPDDFGGNYLHYGVREFAMGAIMNGMALYGGFIPYGGTFLVFSDYMRGAMRLSALMGRRVVWVLTHDSIGLGEDGPTHQPVEHVSSLRLMPQMHVWRPCDAFETAVAWNAVLERGNGPGSLALSRQNLPLQKRAHIKDAFHVAGKGGYVLIDAPGAPQAIVIATGSEVDMAARAVEQLNKSGRRVRLVSMPCCEAFDQADADWKETVLPRGVTARVAVEAGARDYWWKYVGLAGKIIGMRGRGKSAPAPVLYEHFGITVEAVIKAVEDLI
jgi:transketolase